MQAKRNAIANYSDIKLKSVYFLDYDPSHGDEFGKHHMGIVLKKRTHNQQDSVCVIVPITTNPPRIYDTGKIPVRLNNLPDKLAKKGQSYALTNQIKVMDYTRLERIVDKGKTQKVTVNQSDYLRIVELCTDEIESALTFSEKMSFYKLKIDKAIKNEIISKIYIIRNLKTKKADFSSIESEIYDIIYNTDKKFFEIDNYQLKDGDIEEDIKSILAQTLNKLKIVDTI